jgi:hypothetical protein
MGPSTVPCCTPDSAVASFENSPSRAMRKKQLDIVILDFSKACDTVPRDRLLHKLIITASED